MEKKKKRIFVVFLIGFVIGLVGFVSTFIMYLNSSKPILDNTGDKKELPVSGLVFNSIDESIYLEKVIPTLDKFGIMEKGFSFSIKNYNSTTINYEIKLEDNQSTIKNSNVRYELSKNNEVLGIYTLSDDGIIDKNEIHENEEISYTIKLWLDYNSEVKIGSFNKRVAVREIEITEEVNKPVLIDGMIPVYYNYDDNSWHKADDKWYSYEKKLWANAVTVNSDKRKYYENSPNNTIIQANDINSMWVWIPRFNYKINGEEIIINFVDNTKDAYSAFTFNDLQLDGFWFSKFESSMKEDSKCITSSLTKECNKKSNVLYFVPNYPLTTKMSMANIFYAIRKMELKNNIYGFNGTGTVVNNDGTIKNDKNNYDIHMIKNIEWQAVALLSHSKYGINKQIINNNTLLSGKASYDNNVYDYNVLSKGELASTTGNVTGIYDMAGGKREYVMINNKNFTLFNKKSNSGFMNSIKEYYYDNDFSDDDITLKLMNNYSKDNLINNEPITRGGYKNTGNIFNIYGAVDYIDKISVETNSRACLVTQKENKE